MNEELLCYIWQHKIFEHKELLSAAGEQLTIVHPGVRNTDSGPDFTQAKVRVHEDLLVGNVEVHVKASDWKKHGHDSDKAYANVILHVVNENDAEHPGVPTLELKGRIEEKFLNAYQRLLSNRNWIPCENQIRRVDTLFVKSGLHRLLVERMEEKTGAALSLNQQNKNSWEETCYQIIARSFGLKVNADVFELLAKSLPLKILTKHKNGLLQTEALLFGQAGLLEKEFKDAYPKHLKKEYAFLKKKYELQPLEAHLWKFMRLRPAGFPTLRIAQFAKLLHQSTHLFSKIVAVKTASELTKLFQDKPSDYWFTHYRFDVLSSTKERTPGEDFVNTLLVNAVVPLLFVYGKAKGDPVIQEKAFSLLEQIPAEDNSILRKWKQLGISCKTAYESQALLQLKNVYCKEKKCLRCHIGNRLLKS